MPVPTRPRRLLAAALPALLAVFLTACNSTQYPNSIFHDNTEFNRDVGYLFDILLWLGGFVFVFVEGILLYTIFKYRRKNDNDRPKHVHGNTTLEILWTAIPALILAFIAVPTVRVIFKTQATAAADALQVEVWGHQWWWEFRYPQYTTPGANGKLDTLTTANELYLPIGRKANFKLQTVDVLHSFWIPQMGGKRDLITNRVNYLWFTPDSVGENAWNGFCAEFCGESHANMHFKVFSVTPENFAAWTKHQLTPAAFGAVAMTPAPVAAAVMGGAPVQQAGFVTFPREKIPSHAVPSTPLPAGLAFNESLKGDPQRGLDFMTKMGGGCVGCHMINGNPVMMSRVGPNLTHIGSRSTIAGGIFPNDTRHLALWIKNSRRMKPGVMMPTLGAGERDPVTKSFIPKTGLNDQQIADIVAYLQALK